MHPGTSAGGPTQLAPAQDMKMQVIHALACNLPGVGDYPITVRIEPFFPGQLCGEGEQLSKESLAVFTVGLPHGRNVPGGNYQDVSGCLGIDVTERKRIRRALDNLRRDLAGHDFTEQTISHGFPAVGLGPRPPPRLVRQSRT